MKYANPVQRGGAGGVQRRTSGTTAGPASAHRVVQRFAFAVRWPKSPKARRKQAAAVAAHLDVEPGLVVADEWHDGDRLWLALAVDPPLTAVQAEHLAHDCPASVAGSFEVEPGYRV